MKFRRSNIVVAAGIATLAVLSGCGQRESAPSSAMTGAPAASAPVQLASAPTSSPFPVAAPASAAPAVALAPAVLPTAFRQPASSAAPAAIPSTATEELLTVAMWAGIKSPLTPIAAETFANTYERWASMAHEVLDGRAPEGTERMTTKPWTKNVTFLQVNKRTVLFAVLVDYQGRQDSAKTRRVMPVLAQLSDSGQMLVASVDGIPGLGRSDRFLQSWPTANDPINLVSADFSGLRGQIAAGLAQ